MMKHFMMTLIALFCFINVQAQKITRSYDNVSMSEALRDLNEQSRDYNISFLYNDLEDFRVSTSIKHKTVTEAIMQIIGFYPIRVVKRGEREIYVECTHKTERHLTWRREQRGWRFCHPLRAAYRSCPYLIRGLQDRLSSM